MSSIGYALLIHPDDAETPVEELTVSVHVKLNGYLRDALTMAQRIRDRHVARGYAYLIVAGSLTL